MDINLNKVIAEFMGANFMNCGGGIYIAHVNEDFCPKKMTSIDTFCLKYSTSWDWLKPVIDKIIKDIGVKTVDECTDTEWRYYTMISRMWIGISIDQAYNMVCDYILWYNKNKK